MKKVNVSEVSEQARLSPRGGYARYSKNVSQALGREPASSDLRTRHPFDLELLRIPPGKKAYPYHAHSAQWEMYVVVSGAGLARDDSGTTGIAQGDAFIYPPGEAHQLINDGEDDLLLYVIADNPLGETVYYPDSKKHGVAIPSRTFLRGESLDYFDGEE